MLCTSTPTKTWFLLGHSGVCPRLNGFPFLSWCWTTYPYAFLFSLHEVKYYFQWDHQVANGGLFVRWVQSRVCVFADARVPITVKQNIRFGFGKNARPMFWFRCKCVAWPGNERFPNVAFPHGCVICFAEIPLRNPLLLEHMRPNNAQSIRHAARTLFLKVSRSNSWRPSC